MSLNLHGINLGAESCPICTEHERVFRLADIVEGWSLGMASRPPIAAERQAALREALAVPKTARKVTAEDLLRAYNYAAAAGRVFGLHLPHLSRGTYGYPAIVCGVFALAALSMVGEKPLQALLVAAVFGVLAAFLGWRWRAAGLEAVEQARRQRQREARWAGLCYCDGCQAIFPEQTAATLPVGAVRAYVATGALPEPALAAAR